MTLYMDRCHSCVEVQGNCEINFVDLGAFDDGARGDGGRYWGMIVPKLPYSFDLFVYDGEG